MSKRKNYGPYILIASLVLGVFLLTGSFIWMADKSNMLLAVFVLILYGVGQWMTVVYWQNIQNDWEATGEVLGRLQSAVSDIPSALDSNLKAISQQLLEGQRNALASLQTEVTGTAEKTLEKGASMISTSLEKNLAAPLATLQTSMNAWVNQTEMQAQASREFSDLLRTLQAEWTKQIQSLVTGLVSDFQKSVAAQASEFKTSASEMARVLDNLAKGLSTDMNKSTSALAEEFKAMAVANNSVGAQMQKAWSTSAQELQSAWDTRIQRMQEELVTSIATESEKLGASLTSGADALLGRLEGMQMEQAETQGSVLAKVVAELAEQRQSDQAVAGKILELTELMGRGTKDFQALAQLAEVNQVEMQAGVGMLNSGLGTILDRLEKQANAGDGYQTFMSDLSRALASFQKGASDVLIENAMKTQEILMEVLNHAERKNGSEAESVTAEPVNA